MFFDVAEQQEPIGSKEPGDIFFCYSNLSLRQPLKRIQRTFTLLVQGGGVEARIDFMLMRGSDGRFTWSSSQPRCPHKAKPARPPVVASYRDALAIVLQG